MLRPRTDSCYTHFLPALLRGSQLAGAAWKWGVKVRKWEEEDTLREN